MAKSKKAIKELVRKQTPIIPLDIVSAIKRIFDNKHTPADNLVAGDWIKEFKQTDAWVVIEAAVKYVIEGELDVSTHMGTNNDERMGIQVGARKVLRVLLDLERSGEVINKQMEQQRKAEEESKEDVNTEDIAPGRYSGNVGI